MKRFEQRYTDFLAGNSVVALLVVFSLAILYIHFLKLPEASSFHWSGLLPDALSVSGVVTKAMAASINIAGIVAVLIGVVYINRTHAVLHSYMKLYLGVALLILAALPQATLGLCSGTLMAAVLIWVLAVLYSSYKEKRVSRRIFLMFAVLSAGALAQYAFVPFIPVVFLGCAQMRCLNLRNFFAALLGIITPLWIVTGFGLVDPTHIQWPTVVWPDAGHIMTYSTPQLIVIALSLLIAIADTLTNVIKVFYGFNARTRAFNGVLALLTLWTAVCAIVDFDNLNAYIVLLSILTAMQLTLHFALTISRRAYIIISIVLLILISMDIWMILL